MRLAHHSNVVATRFALLLTFVCLLLRPWCALAWHNVYPVQHLPSTSSLMMNPSDVLAIPFPSEEAMKSPKLARSVRRYRLNRGRTDSATVSSRRPDSTKKAVSSAPTLVAEPQQQATVKSEPASRVSSDAKTTCRAKAKTYESTIQALRAYRSIHGNLVMSRRYLVPEDSAYPPEWHGLDLPTTVYNMKWWQKFVKERPDRVKELNSLGFLWERLQPEWNLVLEALVTYASLHGNAQVPNKFVVPHGDEQWPKATWGIPLGNCVYRIRARHDFLRGSNAASRRSQLDRMGFVWDVQEHRFRKFYSALRHYAMLERSGKIGTGQTRALRVPSTFVVPESEHWPEEFWSFPLGARCSAVRQKQLYVRNKPERQQALAEIGFRSTGNADLGWLEVVHAAAIYSRMNGRNLDVPFHYSVPAPLSKEDGNEWPWPEYLWGLPLGQRLKDVRLRGAYLNGDHAEERRCQLDALGFNWKPKRGRRPKRTPQSA